MQQIGNDLHVHEFVGQFSRHLLEEHGLVTRKRDDHLVHTAFVQNRFEIARSADHRDAVDRITERTVGDDTDQLHTGIRTSVNPLYNRLRQWAGTHHEYESQIEPAASNAPQHKANRRPQCDHTSRCQNGEESDHQP